MKMGHLERAIEWLRPLILGSSIWDYCVIWKLGDDPSRFIEWVGCCCNGGGDAEVGMKRQRKGKDKSIPDCKDTNVVHPANTKSCEALARLPSFMSFFCGSIHGEVVISSQPRWFNIAKTSDSKTSNEEIFGTRVLIPVFGGLIELFSTEQIAENGRIIEYVLAHFNSSETETMSNSTITFDGHYGDQNLVKSSDSLPSLNQLQIFSLAAQSMIQIGHQCSDSTLGGSSTGSIPSDERSTPDSTPRSVTQNAGFSLKRYCHTECIVKQETNQGQRAEKKPCKSKNLLTERNRRKRISDGMLTLRSVVPKITKMHKAATLGDAVDYIKELQSERKELLDELEDNNSKSTEELSASRYGEVLEPTPSDLPIFNQKQVVSSLKKCSISQVQIDVNQLGTGRYLLRTVCEHRPGAFTVLLEALDYLGVLIDDVSATICNGKMSCNIMVQTTDEREIQEKDLRDSLMQLDV